MNKGQDKDLALEAYFPIDMYLNKLKNITRASFYLARNIPNESLSFMLRKSVGRFLDAGFTYLNNKREMSFIDFLPFIEELHLLIQLISDESFIREEDFILFERELKDFELSAQSIKKEHEVKKDTIEHNITLSDFFSSQTERKNEQREKDLSKTSSGEKQIKSFKKEKKYIISPIDLGRKKASPLKREKKEVVKGDRLSQRKNGEKENGKKSERKKEILNLLRKEKELSLPDISLHFEGISQKTIQRDLKELIAHKLVKKIGERRWSRYTVL